MMYVYRVTEKQGDRADCAYQRPGLRKGTAAQQFRSRHE